VTNITDSKTPGELAVRLGGRLRRARLGRQPPLTLRDVAGDRLSVAMLSRLERGDVLPSLESLVYLAERLGVSPAELLDPAQAIERADAAASERGQALLDLERPEAALAAFQGDKGPGPSGGSARSLVALGRLRDAKSVLDAMPPNSASYHHAAGELALASRDLHAALEHFGLALAQVTAALERAGAPWAAVTPRRQMVELLWRLAQVHEQRGDQETAVVTYRRALNELAGLTDLTELTTRLLNSLPAGPIDTVASHVAAALASLTACARLDTAVRVALSRIEAMLGRRREALAVLQPIVGALRSAEEPAIASALNAIAGSGREPPAHADDDPVAALERLALGYRTAGQLHEAERSYRQASLAALTVGDSKRAARAILRAGLMWLRAGQRERAMALLQETDARLSEIDDEDPSVPEDKGMC